MIRDIASIYKLIGKDFDWRSFNCFTLAKRAREIGKLPPLPDFSGVYKTFSSLPDGYIENQLNRFAKPVCREPEDWDLCLVGRGGNTLGTIINSQVLYFSFRRKVCMCPIPNLRGSIAGLWEYDQSSIIPSVDKMEEGLVSFGLNANLDPGEVWDIPPSPATTEIRDRLAMYGWTIKA